VQLGDGDGGDFGQESVDPCHLQDPLATGEQSRAISVSAVVTSMTRSAVVKTITIIAQASNSINSILMKIAREIVLTAPIRPCQRRSSFVVYWRRRAALSLPCTGARGARVCVCVCGFICACVCLCVSVLCMRTWM
jgi:hypothetical protein